MAQPVIAVDVLVTKAIAAIRCPTMSTLRTVQAGARPSIEHAAIRSKRLMALSRRGEAERAGIRGNRAAF